MTDQTTEHLLLEDAARQARDRLRAEQKQRAADERADYQEKAPSLARDAAVAVLGEEFADRGTWVAEGEPPEYGYGYSATAEIDGLRFLATTRQRDYGWDENLYLLIPCPNADHEPADRRIPIHWLGELADHLDRIADLGPAELHKLGDCSACYFAREEQVDAPPVPPPPPNATERLVEALEAIIEDRIGQRLDGFLATYLPDRI
jgi:hypothetical protein